MQRANSNSFGNAAHFPSSCDAFPPRRRYCAVSITQAKIKPEKYAMTTSAAAFPTPPLAFSYRKLRKTPIYRKQDGC
jgi:hypothetical protein